MSHKTNAHYYNISVIKNVTINYVTAMSQFEHQLRQRCVMCDKLTVMYLSCVLAKKQSKY